MDTAMWLFAAACVGFVAGYVSGARYAMQCAKRKMNAMFRRAE